jgi:hypothetical protein
MSEVDYYDVQNMVSNAVTDARSEWEDRIRNLRYELLEEIRELRNEVRSLERVLASRTEHLA